MDLDLRYFVARGTNQGRVAYQCYLCRGQTTTDRRRHCRIEGHQNCVRAEKERLDRIASQRAAARVLDQTMMVVDEGISQVEPVVDDTPENHLAGWLEPNVTEIVDNPPIIPLDMFNQEESGNENDDDREELLWMQFLDIAIGQISSEPEGLAEETSVPSFRREEEKIENVTPDNSIWFPFLNKEYMIASLLVGYLHKIISRDLYHQIRAVFTVYHIQLPRWEAVRQMRATIRSMSNHSIIQKESVFNQPMFGLDMKELIADDLMNLLVAPHLEFVPEEAHGTDIYKFAQSTKWLKHLDSDLRVQMCPNQLRTTEETSKNSEELWTYTKETLNPDKLDKKSAELAVRDQINLKFSRRVFDFQQEKIALLSTGEELPTHMMQDVPQELLDMEENELQRMFNPFLKLKGFDTVRDTPVEVLHVFLLGPVKYLFQDFMKGLDDGQKAELLALWISFNTDSLNIPSIRPTSMVQYSSSLVGKDFRIILQAAPFIFFQFMTPSQINIWSSLCHLGSLIFQTHIENMETYILELRNHIDIFLKYIIQDSAQWVNKAKFHMLLHLPESILRYGPASLFATEKFESYNGILRNASIHSNRQSPGQDIAITFSNYHTFRQIISGGFFFDKKQKKYIQASNKVTCIFTQNPLIQQMLGYNQSSSLQNVNYPFVKKLKVPDIDRIATPGDLQNSYPDHEIKQISELQLNGKQVLKKNYFILFNVTQSQETQHIGSVNSIWKVEKPSHQSQFFINTTIFQKMGKNDFYKMREIRRTPHSTFVNLHSVKAGLNAQHNCQHGECKLTATKIAIVERQKSTRKTLELTHTNNERYIVNLASLSSIDYHRKFSDIPADPPSPLQWLEMG
ncbi:hypothetical protein MJO28_014405 [Puccinia striiformis f. sp. tritici]|uniref:Uncharacterized protein n=1 Tax=Puccinia striiformis f. sp. tritici TaxID=168172 RepID=A0ACC0DUM2_9BASI|nr:hypothetical protein MJO28_014405 [Puccinia striiformis f. sp. tritici]